MIEIGQVVDVEWRRYAVARLDALLQAFAAVPEAQPQTVMRALNQRERLAE